MRRKMENGKWKIGNDKSIIGWFALFLFSVSIFLLPCAAPAAEPPVKTVVEKADKTKLAGKITSFDADRFELVNDRNETFEIAWTELTAKNAFMLYARLIEKSNDAEQWIALGELLRPMEKGTEWSDKAFARALRIDPSQKQRVEELKTAAAMPATAPSENSPETPSDGEMSAGPQTVGEVDEKFWGKLSDEEMKKAIESLAAFGDETCQRISVDLNLFQTKYFLFYSDLPDAEAERWALLLDKMYARLCELFDVPKDTNIWRGKCLIFVFQRRGDYMNFQTVMHRTDARGSAGMCHNFGDGTVHIAFFRQPDELTFAHVLVHESVHGFLHRYRKPPSIPTWINEGLAEVIGAELVPNPKEYEENRRYARTMIEKMGGVGDDFFYGRRIQGWQYPVARSMTTMMISENKKGYVDFINGIKDGMEWENSLQEKYGTDTQRLLDFYYDWMGVQRRMLRD